MRRNAAWTLAGLALAALTPTAHAQYYPGYGYYQPPAYRVAPVQYYPMPGAGQYRYMPATYQGYRPMPAYIAQPGYGAQPSYIVNAPLSRPQVQAMPVNRSGEPIVIVPDSSPAKQSSAASTPVAKSLPASTPEIVVTPDANISSPPYVPSHIPGVVTEEYPDACAPVYVMPGYPAYPPMPPQRSCHFMAGIGALYVRPYYDNNRALTVTNLSGGSRFLDFAEEYEEAPYVWAAVIDKSGLGFRGRFWHLEQDNRQSATNNGQQLISLTGLGLNSLAAGSQAVATNDLEMSVADIEAIWSHNHKGLTWVCALGARWAELSQDRKGQVINGAVSQSAVSNHDFEGLGPTLALEMTCGLSKCFAVYLNGRASFLYGNRDFNQIGQIVALSSIEDWISAFDVEAGVQMALPLGKCHLVSRVGVVGQSWLEAGSSVSRGGNLDLAGGVVQVGFHY